VSYQRITKPPKGRPKHEKLFNQITPALPAEGASDDDWRPVALAYRRALERLGPVSEQRCLRGEEDDCGGSNEEHAIAYSAALVGHTLAHLGHMNLTDEGLQRMCVVASNRIVDVSEQTGCDHVADLAAFADYLALNLRHVRLNTEGQAQS
jgi:hypothetical protein